MRRLAIWVVLALVAAVCTAVAGAGPAWAGNGESATTLEGPRSSHYGQNTHWFGRVDDDSDSCQLLTHDCEYPTGTVDLYDGDTATTPFATATVVPDTFLINGGESDYSVDFSGLAPGSHAIHAVYTSSNTFDSSDSRSNPHTGEGGSDFITVSAEPTTTTLSQDFATTTSGGNVRFTVQVTPNDPPDLFHGASPPTGSVDIREVVGTTTTSYGASPIDFSGRAVITVGAIPAGTHNLKSHYNGDANYGFSDSGTVSHTVSAGSTSSSLTTSRTSTVFGQPVTLTDTVSAVAPATGTPTGTVTFNDLTAGGSAGSQSLDGSGVAAITSSALTPGSHSIRAGYPGDAFFLAGDSNTVSVSVSRAGTTTVLGSSLNPAGLGQNVTFTATVAPVAPGTGVPDGTVQFKDGTANLGAPKALVGGVATFSTSSLGGGSHSVTAVYSGSSNYNPSTSTPPLTQTVTCDRTVSGSVTSVDADPNATTCLSGVTVSGNLRIPAGARVSLVNSKIGGLISSAPGAGRVMICNSTVGGLVNISQASGFLLLGDVVEEGCAGNTFQASVTLSGNTSGLNLGNNKITGGVTINNNVGSGPGPNHTSPEIEANTIGGGLGCSGNSPAVSNDGRPNTVTGTRTGQCAAPFA